MTPQGPTDPAFEDIVIIHDRQAWEEVASRTTDRYVMEGFVATNAAAPPTSPRRFVEDHKTVDRALANLARSKGWGRHCHVSGRLNRPQRLVATIDGGEFNPYTGTKIVDQNYLPGGWWLIVPEDYERSLPDDGRFVFSVRAAGRDVQFLALEAQTSP